MSGRSRRSSREGIQPTLVAPNYARFRAGGAKAAFARLGRDSYETAPFSLPLWLAVGVFSQLVALLRSGERRSDGRSLAPLMQKELHWGMSHSEVVDAYKQAHGAVRTSNTIRCSYGCSPACKWTSFAPTRTAARANFERSYTEFSDSPTGYDVSALPTRVHVQEWRGHPEGLQGRQDAILFYIRDPLLEECTTRFR